VNKQNFIAQAHTRSGCCNAVSSVDVIKLWTRCEENCKCEAVYPPRYCRHIHIPG